MFKLVISTPGSRINYHKKKVATRTIRIIKRDTHAALMDQAEPLLLKSLDEKVRIHSAAFAKLSPAEAGIKNSRWDAAVQRAIDKLEQTNRASYRGVRYTIVEVTE